MHSSVDVIITFTKYSLGIRDRLIEGGFREWGEAGIYFTMLSSKVRKRQANIKFKPNGLQITVSHWGGGLVGKAFSAQVLGLNSDHMIYIKVGGG